MLRKRHPKLTVANKNDRIAVRTDDGRHQGKSEKLTEDAEKPSVFGETRKKRRGCKAAAEVKLPISPP